MDTNSLAKYLFNVMAGNNKDENWLLRVAMQINDVFKDITKQWDSAEALMLILTQLDSSVGLFTSIQKTTRICDDCHSTYTDSSEIVLLKLSLMELCKKDEKEVDLQTIMTRYLELRGKFPCLTCLPSMGSSSPPSKEMTQNTTVLTCPEYLFIQCDRYVGQLSGKKNQIKINGTESITCGQSLYKLWACVRHLGISVRSGHYVSYMLYPEPVFFDDQGEIWEKISKSKVQVELQKGYLYFFKRVEGVEEPGIANLENFSSEVGAAVDTVKFAGQVAGEGTQNPGVETQNQKTVEECRQNVKEWLEECPSTLSEPTSPPPTTARRLFGTPPPLKKRNVVETQPEDSDFESVFSAQTEHVHPPGVHHVPEPMEVDLVAIGGRS